MQTPFNMIVLGMTVCGKAHYLLEFLEKEHKGHFDHIYIACPAFIWNTTYKNWKYSGDPDVIVINCNQDDVDYFLKEISYAVQGTNSLIVLDNWQVGKL